VLARDSRDPLVLRQSRHAQPGAGLDFLGHIAHHKSVAFSRFGFSLAAAGYERALRIASRKHDIVPVVVSDPLEQQLPRWVLSTCSIRNRRDGRVRHLRSERGPLRPKPTTACCGARRLFRRLSLEGIAVSTEPSLLARTDQLLRGTGAEDAPLSPTLLLAFARGGADGRRIGCSPHRPGRRPDRPRCAPTRQEAHVGDAVAFVITSSGHAPCRWSCRPISISARSPSCHARWRRRILGDGKDAPCEFTLRIAAYEPGSVEIPSVELNLLRPGLAA